MALLRRRQRVIDLGLRAAFVAVLVYIAVFRPTPAGDAHAYWMVDLGNPYTRPVATQDAFTYPPPAALFFGGLRAVTGSFELFESLWTLIIGFVLLWLTGPWALAFLVLPVVFSDLYLGNIHILLGAAIVASLRWPAAWAIPLLTKPTCGLGLLWFVARGEWRRLGIAIAATVAVGMLSGLLAPDRWPGCPRTWARRTGCHCRCSSGCPPPRCSSCGARARTVRGRSRAAPCSRCPSCGSSVSRC
jgi:hypothetical protein